FESYIFLQLILALHYQSKSSNILLRSSSDSKGIWIAPFPLFPVRFNFTLLENLEVKSSCIFLYSNGKSFLPSAFLVFSFPWILRTSSSVFLTDKPLVRIS